MTTKFDEVFSGYQLFQVSVWNRCFKGHLSPHHQGSDLVTMFKRTHHWYLFWPRCIQSTPPHSITL